MHSLIFLVLFFTSVFLDTQATNENCTTTKCTHGAPDVRFPFQVRGPQPQHCGHPGYEIDCTKDNTTAIHFPSYGDLVVKSISYDVKKLDLLDPNSCVHGVFLNLDLSLTPFQYYYALKEYSYLNCSVRLSPPLTEIPCLSGSRYHVYTVEPSSAVPDSCRAVKTIPIPFAYSPYLSDNSFGLGLTWGSIGHGDSEANEGWRSLHPKSEQETECFITTRIKVVCIAVLFFVAAPLIRINWYRSRMLQCQKEEQDQIQVEKLLGNCKALKPDTCRSADDPKQGNRHFETVLDIRIMKQHKVQVMK